MYLTQRYDGSFIKYSLFSNFVLNNLYLLLSAVISKFVIHFCIHWSLSFYFDAFTSHFDFKKHLLYQIPEKPSEHNSSFMLSAHFDLITFALCNS